MSGVLQWDVWYNTRTGFTDTNDRWPVPSGWAVREIKTGFDGSAPDTKSSPMDINRDGHIDFLHAYKSNNLQIDFGNGSGFSGYPLWPLPISASIVDVQRPDSNNAPNVKQEFFDINGDDLPDLVMREDNGWHIWRNNRGGFSDYGVWPVPNSEAWLWDLTRDTPNLEVGYFDMNGDGLKDIVDGNWRIYFNTGSDFLPQEIWPSGFSDYIRDPDTTGNVKRDLFDINADGLPDIVNPRSGSSTWEIRLNTDRGFGPIIGWPAPDTVPADGYSRDTGWWSGWPPCLCPESQECLQNLTH